MVMELKAINTCSISCIKRVRKMARADTVKNNSEINVYIELQFKSSFSLS